MDELNELELWAEAGGYDSGMPRPLAPWEKNKQPPKPDNGENDIPF